MEKQMHSMEGMSLVEFDFQGVLRRLETETPERRAELFYLLESRWCWECGRTYEACNAWLFEHGLTRDAPCIPNSAVEEAS